MSKRLDDLRKNYDESRVVAAGLNEESAGLKNILFAKQEQVMETVRKDLREFAGYAAGLNRGWYVNYLHECQPSFARSSYGDNFCLIVACEPDGNIKLQGNPGGYSHRVDIYDLKSDSWGWYTDKCKAYVTENWGKIAEQIEEGLARDLENAALEVVDVASKKRDELQVAIGEVSQNIDLNVRKDIVLYNAISLLIDETLGQYDDTQEWFDMLQKELGVSVEELEKMGIVISSDGGLERVEVKPLSEKLLDAQERADGAKEHGKEILTMTIADGYAYGRG